MLVASGVIGLISRCTPCVAVPQVCEQDVDAGMKVVNVVNDKERVVKVGGLLAITGCSTEVAVVTIVSHVMYNVTLDVDGIC